MPDSIKALATQIWLRLVRLARARPWHSAILVITLILVVSGAMGFVMVFIEWEDSLVRWLDNAFIVLTSISLAIAWSLALILYAKRWDAAHSFRHAGERVECPRFKAALILASQQKALIEWHLRHIPHERVEFVWTDFTAPTAADVLNQFPGITCVHGPGQSDEKRLEDPFELAAVKRHCRLLLKELLVHYPPEQICVDITGGTAIMSLATFQAAEELRVTSLYLLGTNWDDKGKLSIRAAHVDSWDEGQIKLVSDHSGASSEAADSEIT